MLQYNQYNRKVLPETRSRTRGLSFNIRARYQLSYLDRLLFCYLNSEFILITRASHVCVGCVVQGGTCMQVATHLIPIMLTEL